MRKVKKFSLNQSHFLSSDEMAKLNGGVYLHDSCDENNVGQACLYSTSGSHYTGTCHYVHSTSSNGSSTTTVSGYFCIMD